MGFDLSAHQSLLKAVGVHSKQLYAKGIRTAHKSFLRRTQTFLFGSYVGDPVQLCLVIQERAVFTIGAKLHVPQVEDARNDPKQVLHRMGSRVGTCKTLSTSDFSQLTFVSMSSMLMICRAFFTVFQSFLSFMEDTLAHCPCCVEANIANSFLQNCLLWCGCEYDTHLV